MSCLERCRRQAARRSGQKRIHESACGKTKVLWSMVREFRVLCFEVEAFGFKGTCLWRVSKDDHI